MKQHPIIFSGLMVRAILDERKTQTRRVVKFRMRKPSTPGLVPHDKIRRVALHDGKARPYGGVCGEKLYIDAITKCPYGIPGDRLWVRETWAAIGGAVIYRADHEDVKTPFGGRWRPSIHMPKWACRLWLEVLKVRAERVQDISKEDIRAEGFGASRYDFRCCWNVLNADRGYSWANNNWVWVDTFKRAESP